MKPIRLYNKHCPYCGYSLSSKTVTSTVEHVIARRFVPKGFMENEWNLILNACSICNSYKASLENGLSAMSLLSFDKQTSHPEAVANELARKTVRSKKSTNTPKAFHPETLVPVADSFHKFQIEGKLGPLTMTFKMEATPQAFYSEQILAQLQLQAFFFLISNPTDAESSKHEFSNNPQLLREDHVHFFFPGSLKRNDWGNCKAVEVVKRTRDWKPLLIINSAKGFFKTEIRHDGNFFFWALEWNQNFRQLGLLKRPGSYHKIEQDLPEEPFKYLSPNLKGRLDINLDPSQDLLFKS